MTVVGRIGTCCLVHKALVGAGHTWSSRRAFPEVGGMAPQMAVKCFPWANNEDTEVIQVLKVAH
jgi:hypothetical protein